jgi:hypothetical protein
MKKITLFCITFWLLMVCSGLSQNVDFRFDKSADFSKFKTYKWWVTPKKGAPIDNLTDEQIKATVDAALAQKGLNKVDTDTADLLIDYQTREQITENAPRVADQQVETVYEGDLAIDMYTPANHNLVWRGVASKALDPNAKPEKRQKNLTKAVAKLMANYPPPK